MCKKLVVALMLLGVASYASAYMPNQVVTHDDTDSILLSSFEGGMDGWFVYTANGGVGTATTGGSYGATEGFYSLKLSTPNSWWDEALALDIASIDGGKDAFFGNNTLSMDVSWKSSEWVDASTGWNYGPTIGLIVNPDKAWNNGQNPLNWWKGPDESVPAYSSGADGTVTLSWNYDSITGGSIDSTSTKILFDLVVVYSQFVEPTALYIDNVQLSGTGYVEKTPEPTTIALLGLGSLALLRRKK